MITQKEKDAIISGLDGTKGLNLVGLNLKRHIDNLPNMMTSASGIAEAQAKFMNDWNALMGSITFIKNMPEEPIV